MDLTNSSLALNIIQIVVMHTHHTNPSFFLHYSKKYSQIKENMLIYVSVLKRPKFLNALNIINQSKPRVLYEM